MGMSISKRIEAYQSEFVSSRIKKMEEYLVKEVKQTEKITIHTDGCKKGDGSGAWACIITLHDRLIVLADYAQNTTNNKMEIAGFIEGMRMLHSLDLSGVRIISDSQYCVKGFNSWMHNWQRKGWRKGGGEIKNLDLWKEMFRLKPLVKGEAQWVKGHHLNQKNNLCDLIANISCYGELTLAMSFDSVEAIDKWTKEN